MAPTEILAQQHYRELEPLLGQAGIKVGLITGSTPKKQRAATEEQLRTGELDAVIGTHALLSEDVVFHRLGLVITDEQHRFGVMQRTALSREKRCGGAVSACARYERNTDSENPLIYSVRRPCDIHPRRAAARQTEDRHLCRW